MAAATTARASGCSLDDSAEAASISNSLSVNSAAGSVATTCGRPIADFELRIDSPAGDAGEVLLRGPNVMLGYLDDPDATAAAIDADGWLHTGDIGTVDAAGNLRITDRLKDMYICGGFNVFNFETVSCQIVTCEINDFVPRIA